MVDGGRPARRARHDRHRDGRYGDAERGIARVLSDIALQSISGTECQYLQENDRPRRGEYVESTSDSKVYPDFGDSNSITGQA